MTARALLADVDGDAGYSTALRLSADDLAVVRGHIERQWLDHLRDVAPAVADDFAERGIERYHELADRVDHAQIWPKRERILPAAAVDEIKQTSFVDALRGEMGDFAISDEDEVGWEEIYWRLVRPHEPGDMGPLHADAWFWELGHGTTPPRYRRVKIWGAVVTEPGASGLRLVPGSHRREWRYHGERRDGKMKPQLDENEYELNSQLVPTEPGDAIVFHDRLLHGGAYNSGSKTRISFEWTMFVDANRSGS